jgi:hypothetical protein
VAASLRLKLWELARLNREGALPLPPRWPARLAGLFWPLVLLLGFVVVTVLGMTLQGAPSPLPPPAPASPPAAEAEAAPREPPSPQPAAEQPPLPSPETTAPESPAPQPAEAPTEPDPLLRQLGREGEADPLLAGVDAAPAAGVLRLRLAAGFGRLSRQERQARAERWQERAGRLGYERLELQAAGGRPLGRSALVGSGMILLDPDPSAS